jgi:lipopolysaccharide heptosyltransferase II
MNILQVLPSLDVGGVETGTVDLARYLVMKGHKAIVASSGGRLVKELEAAGARHYTLPVHKKDVFNVIKMVGELRAIIRKEDIDVVHARSRAPAWSSFFAARMMKRPFITTAHGHYSRHFFSEVMGWGRLVIVGSNVMARHMTHDFGVPHTRIRLIPRGVDLDKFTFRGEREGPVTEFTIGMISRITPLKGHPDFLKAASIISRSIPRLRVIIVGDVPKGKEKYREELELLTRRLGLSRTVEFSGTQEDVPGILKNLDVLVSATVTQEAFGRSIVEAQASGVPVVATRVGGVVDIVEDGANGLLCNPSDPKDMAEAVLRIYRDRNLRDRIVARARQRVEERFTLNQMAEATMAVYEEAMRQLNILVIKMSSIGDCILSMPSLRAIRSKFKDATVKVLVGLPARDVFKNCPYIDDRIVCDLKGKDRGPWGFWRLAKALQKEYFDIVVDLQNNKASHLLAFLSLASLRYGYDNGKWSFLLNRTVKDDRVPIDPIEHQGRTLATLGVTDIDKTLELFPGEDEERWVQDFLRSHWIKPGHILIGIALRASSKWLTKNWPLGSIAELCDRLGSRNIRAVITGAQGDAALAKRLMKSTHSKPILALGKTSILELAALMRHFSCFITPDSAPMHIARSMGVPVVALFGPTDPARHFVPSAHSIVLRKAVRCGPCYSPHCMRNFKCMKGITVDEVFEAAEKILSGPREDKSTGHLLSGEEAIHKKVSRPSQ